MCPFQKHSQAVVFLSFPDDHGKIICKVRATVLQCLSTVLPRDSRPRLAWSVGVLSHLKTHSLQGQAGEAWRLLGGRLLPLPP